MADVADGRLRADAGPGASFHRAGKRNRPCLWPEALHGRDPPPLRRAGPASGRPRVRRRRFVRRGLRDPRLGLAPPAPQGRAEGFSQCRALVQRADGAPRHQARHGSEAGLEVDCHHPPCVQLRTGADDPVTPAFAGHDGIGPPHAFLASNANRTARPASTVPISQRCTNSQVGRVPRNTAIDPAASAITALMPTLMTVWIVPSTSDCVSTLPTAGSMNCGSSARYSIAILGFSRLVTKPIANNLRGPSTCSFLT